MAVALSADGDRALVGALYDDGTRGAAWVFRRSGSTWAQEGGKLTGGDAAGEGEFGTNVALSADGDTALIGGWRDNGGTGASWVFVDPPSATSRRGDRTLAKPARPSTEPSVPEARARRTSSTGRPRPTGPPPPPRASASPASSPLAAAIGGLAPGTIYHYRLVAENSGGVAYGGDQTFTSEADHRPAKPPVRRQEPADAAARAPEVQNAHQSATRWREGNRLAAISRAKNAHRNDLLVLTQRAGNRDLQLRPGVRGRQGGNAHLHRVTVAPTR